MKTNDELRAALNMVLARLDSNPRTTEEWKTIEAALRSAAGYAGKKRAFHGATGGGERRCYVCAGPIRGNTGHEWDHDGQKTYTHDSCYQAEVKS